MTTIIPAGAPAWTRTADHAVYGGDTNKTNWHDQGVTNARTDVGAEQLCRMASDLAAAVRTSPFAIVTIGAGDTAELAWPAFLAVNQMTGVAVAPYGGSRPPFGGFPTVIANGIGDVTITWPAVPADDYGVTAPLNFRHVEIGTSGGAPFASAWTLVDGNGDGLSEAVRVRVFAIPGGAPAATPRFTVAVYT